MVMKFVNLQEAISWLNPLFPAILLHRILYSRTPLIWINWDSELSGYAENPGNWIFLLKTGHIGSLKFSCYYLQYIPVSKPFNHAW